MICTQSANPAANGRILLASDLASEQEAAEEISGWLHAHGYRPVPQARPLLAYENGVCVRHWLQAEPQPHSRPTYPSAFFRSFFAARFAHH